MLHDFENVRKYSFAAPDAGSYALGCGSQISGTQAKIFIPFPCKMLSAPTGISISDVSHFQIVDGADEHTCIAMAFLSATKYGVYVLCTVTSGLNNTAISVLFSSSASATFEVTGGTPDY